ncbi:MAG TPA: SDR family NAD(P)-dependent oxidoreductase [Kiloniellales bacterium]
MRDKVVLVTGGNSGIGRGIVRCAAGEGARVAIAGRDPEKGADTLEEIRQAGGEAAFFAGDLSREAEARDLVEQACARFGRLDVVVNNAGVGSRRCGVEPADGPGARLRKLMGPNLEAAYFVSAYAMPALKAAGGGAIVNISSTATFHGNWGTYGVAKAGVEALTRAQAAEGAPFGIRANAVSPGWIKTDATQESGARADWETTASLLGRMGVPEEIARAVIFLASDEASFVTGATLIVDGGLTVTDYPSLPFLEAVGAWKLFPGLLEAAGDEPSGGR